MFNTPILFLIFNRPDTTKQVFESIRKVRPNKLYLAADGPRASKLGEVDLCMQTRNIVSQIDWDCEIKTLFRDENLGCKIAVSSAIDWFFENEEQGIILEDDCLPHESFYGFCETLLNYYKNDGRVFHISGNNFQDGIIRGDGSFYFSKYNHIWGWATWKRAWKMYDVNLKFENEKEIEVFINRNFEAKKEQLFWTKLYKNFIKSAIDTWDYQWTYAIWKNNGLSIIPNKNLVSNIGFDSNGTHTNGNDILGLGNTKTSPISKIINPSVIVINKKADKYTLDHYFNPSIIFYIYKKILHHIKKIN